MKTVVIVSILVICLFLISQSFILFSVSKIEQHSYEVIHVYDDFEIRRYDSALFSSVIMDGSSYDQMAHSGFRILAGYIFGGNEKGQKIAMTSPVTMELSDSIKMSFMVPSGYSENDLPKPTNGRIFFERKKRAIMSAIRFGGWANDSRIEKYKHRLMKALQKEGLAYTGNFSYLGYNSPFALVARRNEIVVELINFEK